MNKPVELSNNIGWVSDRRGTAALSRSAKATPRPEAMSCYPSSTQRRHWTLSTDEIARRRSEARARAIDAANESRAARTGDASAEAPPDPPTPEEEATLRRYYEVKIQKVCQAFSLPTKVRATAVALFKRFLTRTSPLERSHSLKVTMLTSIYVACKVEENYVSADEFGKGMQEDSAKVLAAELSILSGLEFQLVTYSPYRAVDGLAREIKPDVSEHLAKAAHAVCDAILLTDAPLIHPPGKLALAALRSAAANTADESAVKELVERLGSGDASLLGDVNAEAVDAAAMDAAADLATDLDAVDALVEAQGSEPDEETARAVDKKLRAWHRGGRSGAGDGGEGEGDGGGAREGKRRKSAADERKRKEAAEEAALDGP